MLRKNVSGAAPARRRRLALAGGLAAMVGLPVAAAAEVGRPPDPTESLTDDPPRVERAARAPAEVGLAAELGLVGGGGATPGGMRVGGRYLYRMDDQVWFDAGVGFTFGAPTAGCGRTPPDAMSCDHGVASGFSGDLIVGLRRDLRGQRGFVPFVHGGAFGRVLRFAADDVTGIGLGLEAGAGVARAVRGDVALRAGASAQAGRAWLGRAVGGSGQLGLTVTVGAELRLP
ncbi:MAG: hypothetical protein KJZ91_17690 [Myxococcales bacterium]|nr:hypothetical protein [Myxococcales bacterium]